MATKTIDCQDIAVTGLSGRFPGKGNTIQSFWKSICLGESAWSGVPPERFNMDAFWSSSEKQSTGVANGGHFLQQDISQFDASFFGLPKHDADAMDPQQRIMTEVAYEALESAGLPLDQIAGSRTGVFMGHFTSDYRDMICRDPDNAPLYTFTGTGTASLANRISWLWDLKGPSFTINTACSSSLLALHLACQSLRTGESDIAIVGGSNLLMNPEMFIFLSNQGFLSPDGLCKSFDESANGYGRGEGFGCVILKRIDDAVLNGDAIRAVIRGTASNQDGHTKGLTTPNAEAQAALIEEVYQQAGLDFKMTDYVEAHGTGTQAGDTQEMEALARTIGASHSAESKLIVGSVKSNIGHLEAAAGIAGFIKAVLMLENGLIPPNIHFKKGNPKILFDEWNIRVPTGLTPWPTDGVRRISVSSFGYGGTNVHAIVEDAHHYLNTKKQAFNIGYILNGEHTLNGVNGALSKDHVPTNCPRTRRRLFVWSAQDKDGLQRAREPLAKYLEAKAAEYQDRRDKMEVFMSELAYTLSERRSRLQWKTYTIASSLAEISPYLDGGSTAPAVLSSRNPRIGFVFTGQGAQWPRMGVELMVYKVFREGIAAAGSFLQRTCGCPWSAAEELQRSASASQVNLSGYSHTLCTILQIALVDLLQSWGIIPTAVVGHSGGEIAAAYAFGAITREDGWAIGYHRGRLASEMKIKAPKLHGAMMAVSLSQERAVEWISKVTDGHLVVACINSPSSTTLSGDDPGIEQLLRMLKEEDIFARKLMVDTAYHSPHMQVIAEEYYALIADITPLAVQGGCTMYSSVTGAVIEAGQLHADHWTLSLTSPVRFSEAVYDMLRPTRGNMRLNENAVDVLVEIGPHSALNGPSTQSLKAHNITNVPYYSVLTRNQNAVETAMNLAGLLFNQGYKVNIREVNDEGHMNFAAPLADLPTYNWNHSQRFWHESRVEREFLSREMPRSGLLGAPSPSITEGERIWKGFIRLSEEPWINDHKIHGAVIYPGAGYIAMALEAATQTADITLPVSAYKLRDIQLTSAALIAEGDGLECIVQLRPHVAGTRNSASTWIQFIVTTSPDGKTLLQNCRGLLLVEYEAAEGTDVSREKSLELQALKTKYVDAKQACVNRLDPATFYADMRSRGLDYGPAFANVCEVQNRDGQSIGAVRIPDIPSRNTDVSSRPHVIHPGTLDAVFHLAFAAIKGGVYDPSTAMVPKSIDTITISAGVPFKTGTKLPGFSNAGRHGLNELLANIVMLDDQEDLPTIVIEGFLCTEIAGASSNSDENSARSLTSNVTWRPAVGLLSPDDLCSTLSGHVGEAKLVEYLKLLHHSTPVLSVLEIGVEPESQESTPSTLLQQDCLASVARTWDVTMIYGDEMLKEGDQQEASADVVDFGQDLPTDMPENYDLLIASKLGSYKSDPMPVVEHMSKIAKPGGTICILATDSVLASIQPFLSANHMETTVLRNQHASDTASSLEPSLVIAQRSLVSTTNGTDGVNGVEAGRQQVTLVQAASPTEEAVAVASQLIASLGKYGYETQVFSWGSDISTLAGKSCISLLEFQKPLLLDLDVHDFESVKKLLLEAGALFWVTAMDDPGAAIIDGLVRVVRNETSGLSLRVFHADEPHRVTAKRLVDMATKAFLYTGNDNEFRVQEDLLHVSRINEDTSLNEEIRGLLPGVARKVSSVPFKDIQYPVKLCIRSPGILSSVCLEPDDSVDAFLEPDFVEIHVKATALNFREIMVAMGQMADSKLGIDAAGVVRRVGSSVTKFKVGDKIAMYGHGAHRTIHRSRADFCEAIPEGMSFEQAATIPAVHATAWNALIRLARVQKGQSILIHAAAGGVGQVAVQIARHTGMEIFATVSSEVKRKLLRDEYGVLDDHIFNSRDLSFVKGVQRMTKGRGVDVILNSLAGEALRQTWHCIAPFGYFVEIGIRDIINNTGLDMRPFMQDATFSFFNLTHIEHDRPDIMADIVHGAFDLLRRGITRPVTPMVTFPISDVEGALRLMQTGKHLGKIALTWDADHAAAVPVVQSRLRAPKLRPDGVYLLVGGLGGLGRSLSSKLVGLGARRLCFLSRSGAVSASAKDLIDKLERQQIRVQVEKCDVADERAVAAAVKSCTQKLGKICGVFQCAMVLRDGLFANMTHRQWAESTRPKIQGSWNLHQHLPYDLDFFITLSSFTATLGSRGQSNYAAGGAYEDALAYHRRARGLRATTVDLGLMRDIGVLAETGMTDAFREWEKPYGIREGEFLALMERVIDRDIEGIMAPQVLTGFATGGSVSLAGIKTPYYLEDARFSILARTGVRDGGASAAASDAIPAHMAVSQAKSFQEAADSILVALVGQVAKMLQTLPSEIDTSRFLHSFGVDSLVAIEIVNFIMKEAKAAITIFDVLAGIPMTTFSNRIAAKSTVLPKELVPVK